MGALLHPVGPENPRVYWTRRAIVLVAIVAVALTTAWAFWPRPPAVSAVPAPAMTTPAPSAPATSATPAGSTTTTAKPSVTPSPTPTGPVTCLPTNTRLTVAGFQEVKAGSKQVFTLSAANDSADACILAIKPSTYRLTVTSGADKIWTTAHCDRWLPVKTVTLKPGQQHEFTVTWPMRRSSNGCKTPKDAIRPGTYVATAEYLITATARQVMRVTK